MQLSSSQTQSGEIPLESWRILEGLDAIKVKNKKQIFFLPYVRIKKILIWVMSQENRFFNLDCSAKPKTPQNPLQCLLMGELFSELQNPFLSPWNMCQICTRTQSACPHCVSVYFYEKHNTMTFWKAYCLGLKQPMEIANCKSNQVLASPIQQEFLSFFHPELKLPQTLTLVFPALGKQIYFILTCLLLLSRTVCWDLHG